MTIALTMTAPLAPATLRYNTAMRTGTPLVTCRSTTDMSESTTRESISTPRFMGPGCMINVVGLEESGALDRQTVGEGELVEARDERTRTSLALETEQPYDVRPRRARRRSR